MHRFGRSRRLWFLVICSTAALAGPRGGGRLEFGQFTNEDGLSHSQVLAIVQDQQGFVWFGTRAGLNRYDGYRCRIFDRAPEDTSGISGNFILSLLVTRDGSIWIGTAGSGISCFDPVTERFSTFHEYLTSNDNIVSLCEDSSGTIWAGTSSGLMRIHRDSSGVHTRLLRIPGSDGVERELNVTSITQDHAGNLWVATINGLWKLPPRWNSWAEAVRIPGCEGKEIGAMVAGQDGSVWVGFTGGGVLRIDAVTGGVSHFLPSVKVNALYSDRRGTLWVGSLDDGLFHMIVDTSGEARTAHYSHDPDNPSGIGADQVNAILEDRAGKMWFGTKGGGVSVADPMGRKFRVYRHIPNDATSLSHNNVRAITRDSQGNLWVGTYGGGINRQEPCSRGFAHYRQATNGLPDDLVNCLLGSSDGALWVGTVFSGLIRFHPETGLFTSFKRDSDDASGISAETITSLLQDRKGRVWIATHGGSGLSMFDPGSRTFRHFGVRHGEGLLATDRVWALFEDSRGAIWAGTPKHGAFRWNESGGSFTHYSHEDGVPSSLGGYPVICFAEDQDGRLWIGSAGGGLQMKESQSDRFRHFTTRDGLPDNNVYGILVDRSNVLWISTGKGIIQFQPGKGVLRTYDASDGLQSNEFNQRACFMDGRGRMYFGGINGFNVFAPDSIHLNPVPPPVVITRFAVFDTEVPLAQSINVAREIGLAYDQNFFSFEFAALDFTAPEKNRYAYQLEGFDRDWVEAGKLRLASYTNVGPGEYLFRVKGSNNDGLWNEEGTSVRVVVRPPFWGTWWFRIVVALLVVALLYVVYYHRVNKLLAVERTRSRIARDLHDEVSAIMSGISYFSRAIRDDPANVLTDKSSRFMGLINESSTEVLELLHDIIWSINPDNDRFDNIVAKLRRFASDLCESRSIRHTIEVPDLPPERAVDMDRRKNFWLLYKEMVTNAVRHSGCSELRINLDVRHDGAIRLRLADNGRGFEPGHAHGRNGLKNIQARASLLDARLSLHTAPGAGTLWDVECKLWQ